MNDNENEINSTNLATGDKALVKELLNELSPQTKLADGDMALLKSVKTGDGLVTLTPELMTKISDSLKKRQADIDERYPKLVAECPYETRLAVTAWVMKHIVEHAIEGGSFRYLIYDRLGFKPDAYVPLCENGIIISNEFEITIISPDESKDG